jgi:malate/lactate dehydrogenase
VKIGVIGAGAVGSACAFATVMRGCARIAEIVLRGEHAVIPVAAMSDEEKQGLQRSADALRSAMKRAL